MMISASHAPPIAAIETEQRLRESAEELVGQVFYGTLLRQMRDASIKGDYGHGGRGEEAFAAQLHEELAARAGRARGNNLTEAIVDRYAAQAEVADRFRTLQQEVGTSRTTALPDPARRGGHRP